MPERSERAIWGCMAFEDGDEDNITLIERKSRKASRRILALERRVGARR